MGMKRRPGGEAVSQKPTQTILQVMFRRMECSLQSQSPLPGIQLTEPSLSSNGTCSTEAGLKNIILDELCLWVVV